MVHITALSTIRTTYIEQLIATGEKIKKYAEEEVLGGLTLLQFNILGELTQLSSPTIKDIKGRLIASSASLSQTLNRMERDGYIRRSLGVEDRRIIQIQLTEKGKKTYDIANKNYIQITENQLIEISDSELLKQTQQLEIIEKKIDALNGIHRPPDGVSIGGTG